MTAIVRVDPSRLASSSRVWGNGKASISPGWAVKSKAASIAPPSPPSLVAEDLPAARRRQQPVDRQALRVGARGRLGSVEVDLGPGELEAPLPQPVGPGMEQRDPHRRALGDVGLEAAALPEQLLAAVAQRAADHPRLGDEGRLQRAARTGFRTSTPNPSTKAIGVGPPGDARATGASPNSRDEHGAGPDDTRTGAFEGIVGVRHEIFRSPRTATRCWRCRGGCGEEFSVIGPVGHLRPGERAEVRGEWQTALALRTPGQGLRREADRSRRPRGPDRLPDLASPHRPGPRRAAARRLRRRRPRRDRRRPRGDLPGAAAGSASARPRPPRSPGTRAAPSATSTFASPRTASPTWRPRSTPASAPRRCGSCTRTPTR